MKEICDSSTSTLEHIIDVGNNINVVINALKQYKNIELNDNINNMTIIDILYILLRGEELNNNNSLLKSIYNNSFLYLYNEQTMKQEILYKKYVDELLERKLNHDKSKLEYPEKEEFDKYYKIKGKIPYGSSEYYNSLNRFGKALEHHYRYNRHHPEHFSNLIYGMTIMDVIEMLCDWEATAAKQSTDAIYKGIEVNSERFSYDKKMVRVLSNTVDKYFKGGKER